MRIGVYLRETSPEVGGGYTFEQVCFERFLARASVDHNELVVFGPPGPALNRAETAGAELVRLPSSRWGRRALRLPTISAALGPVLRGKRPRWRDRRIDRIVTRARPDLVVSFGPETASHQVPYMVVVWDLQHRLQPFFPEVGSSIEWWGREHHFTETLRRAAYVVVGTERGAEELQHFYGVARERILIIPHPVPDLPSDVEDAAVLGALGLTPGYLLYPAQFWPHKDHITLVEALGILRNREGRTPTVVMVGSDKGNRDFVVRKAESLGVADQLRILGFVRREQLGALYRGASALTYTSHFGPENLPPLEAFVSDCPVIATDVPGSDEQLGDAAVRFPVGDEQALARAIIRVTDDPLVRSELIRRGRERARQRSPDRFVEDVFQATQRFRSVRRAWP